MRQTLFVLAVFALGSITLTIKAAEAPSADQYLQEGKLPEGIKVLQALVEKNSGDDEARFGLGTLQFLHGIERLGQSFYRYGVQSERARQIPFLRLPIPDNDKPEKLSYSQSRKVLEDLISDLSAAEQTLAKIDDEKVKLAIQ